MDGLISQINNRPLLEWSFFVPIYSVWGVNITENGYSTRRLSNLGLLPNRKSMITLATYKDHEEIIKVWEESIRVTHHFLGEEYLQEIKSLIPSTLQQVKVYAWREKDGRIKGFTGIGNQKMEMLFIHPSYFGRRLGTQLTNFCIHSLNVDEVDVNEQNEPAVHFYAKMGYRLVGRNEVDSQGKPFAILHLKHTSS